MKWMALVGALLVSLALGARGAAAKAPDPCGVLQHAAGAAGLSARERDWRGNLVGCDEGAEPGTFVRGRSACEQKAYKVARRLLADGADMLTIRPADMRLAMKHAGCGVLYEDWSWGRA